MLILPMERTFDIRRPPVVTFTLVLINVIVFIAASGSNEDAIDSAIEQYEAAEIIDIELPLFQEYLSLREESPPGWDSVESVDDLDEFERYYMFRWILTDGEYAEYLERGAGSLLQIEEQALAEKQEIIEEYRESAVNYRFGFVPAEFSVFNMFTSQFLHGDLAHLLGNMVILVLIGLTVEQLLGSFNYLLFYLLSGAVGAIAFGLVHLGSPMPAVGASGADRNL